MNKSIFKLLLSFFLFAGQAYSKCIVSTPKEQLKNTPFIVKGKVQNYLSIENSSGGNDISFNLLVTKVLKGNMKSGRYKISYRWFEQSPALRTYNSNDEGIFLVHEVDGISLKINASTCTPIFGEKEAQQLLE